MGSFVSRRPFFCKDSTLQILHCVSLFDLKNIRLHAYIHIYIYSFIYFLQVLKLQTDLASVQACLSTFQALIPSPASARNAQHSLPAHSSEMASVLDSNASFADLNFSVIFDPVELLQQSPGEITGFSDPISDTQQLAADAQLQAIAREFVSHCLPGVKIGPPGSPKSPWK